MPSQSNALYLRLGEAFIGDDAEVSTLWLARVNEFDTMTQRWGLIVDKLAQHASELLSELNVAPISQHVVRDVLVDNEVVRKASLERDVVALTSAMQCNARAERIVLQVHAWRKFTNFFVDFERGF